MREGSQKTHSVIKNLVTLSMSLFIGLSSYSSAWANPIDGQVTGGSATISQPNSTTVQVNQTSDKAVIDWHSFNIAPNEHTAFQQPSRNSIVLNRANPANGASSILGRLTANGNVWLVNPAGVLFGSSARVDVGGLLATTGWISKDDFMNGNYHFKQLPGWYGSVINRGMITIADEGLLLLVAPGVENSGIIQVNLGQVILASGNEFTVDFYGDQLINFHVDAKTDKTPIDENGKPLKAAVSNSGTIIANGGKVLMTAQTAEGIVDQAINMSGFVEAQTAVQQGGEIVLMGGDHGTVNVSGVMVASGKQAGQKGGNVKVLGKKIEVMSTATIDASGDIGGGEVLIGGDYQGKNPDILNANQTYVGNNVLINVDALTFGNAGKVIVWANDTTQFYGNILARGGSQGGDGGFVETSGKKHLDANGGFVDARAPLGTVGTWLLDPTNIYIALNQANATTAGMSGTNTSANTGSGGIPNIFAATGAIQDSLLTTGNLNTALGTANVIVTTTNASGTGLGNITVVDPISWSSTNTLTLTAANNIAINAGITTGASGSRLILDAAGSVTQSAVISGSGGLTQQGAGTVTLTQANTYSGSTLVNGALALSGSGTALNTAFTVNQAGILTLDNSSTNVGNRISDSNALTLNGGEFVFKGSSSTNASETIGALTLPSGYSTITLVSGAGGSTGLTFASINRSAGALVLFRGTNLGSTAGAGNTNINFTSATGLSLTGGNTTQVNKPIVPYAIGDTLATGTGTSFVTYNVNPASNAANTTGIRPLSLTAEYTLDALSTGNNTRLTSGNTTATNTTINSLLLDGGILNFGNNTRTVVITSGALARTTGGLINSTNSTSRITDFGSTEAKIFAIGSFNIESALTGSGGLTMGGPGALTVDIQVKTLTGGLTINSGVLQSGIASAFASQAVTVRAGGTFNLAGFNNSISTLALESGSTIGGSVTTGAATLTLGGNVAQSVNGSGASSASITGNLALGATRTFTTADGNATNDLSISALISGSGFGIIKSGSGQLILSGLNNYTGTTSVSSGTLSIANSASLGSTSSTSVTSDATLDLAFNSATLGNTNTITLNGTGVSLGALTLSGNGITVNNPMTISTSSTIGGTGTGTMTFGGAVSGTSINLTYNLMNAGISLPAITLSTSGNLSVTTNGAIAQTGILTVPGTASFTAGANAITLGQNNVFTGAVSLSNSGANNISVIRSGGTLSLGTVNVGTGTLGVTGVGVSQTGTITQAASAGGVTINAGAGAITLANANSITGSLSLNNSGANNIQINNSGLLTLGASNVGTGSITLTGVGLSQTGSITQAVGGGVVSLNAGAGAINLTDSGNVFRNTVSLSNSGANNVALTNSLALSIGSSTLGTGNLTLTGAGVSQTSGISQGVSAGAVTINAGANPINLSSVNTFTGAVSLNNSGANNVSINNGNTLLTIGTSNVGSGTLTFTGGSGGIAQTGVVTQAAGAGTVSFSVGTGAINFTQNNIFTGGININNSSGSANLAVTNSLLLTLAGGGWSGSGTATYNGAGIAQSAAITINGAATFNAGANAINLSNASNSFGSTVALNNSGANNVTVTDSNGSLDLATSNVGSGTLTLTGVGLTQTGAITQESAAGTATFNSSGSNITLTNSSNVFTGPVAFTNTSGGNVSITDSTPLSLATSSWGTGSVALVSGGSVSQTGALTGTGTVTITLSSGSSDILLITQANNLGGSIFLNNQTNIQDFALRNINASPSFPSLSSATNLRNVTAQFDNGGIMLSAMTLHASGNLSVAAGGSIDSNGTITVPGTSSFTAGTSISLLNSNAFTGAITINNSGANNVNIINSGIPLTIASANVGTGTLSLSGLGLTQTGAIVQAVGGGSVTLGGSAGAINLTNSGNVFRGGIQLTNSGANNVDLTNSIALSLSAASVGTGTLTLTGVGISQTGTIVQANGAGAATFNAGAGAINLSLGNNFKGPVSLNNSGANNVAINNNISYALGTSNVGSGTLTIGVGFASAVTLTQTGVITQAAGAGAVTISAPASGSDINLGTQANNFTGNITFGGTLGNIRDVSLRNTNSGAALPTNLASLSNLRNLTLEYNNTSIAFPALTLTSGGNLSITAGGAITQTGILTVPGTASFTTGANVITLGQNNVFTGAVSLSNSGANNVSIVRSGGTLSLGTVNVGTGALGLTGVGVSQAGTITQVAGAGVVTINAGAGAINLTNANLFTGTVSLNNSGANNVALTNSIALSLGTSNVGTGTLGLTGIGVSQVGAITQAVGGGVVTINAGVGAISLTDAGNIFRGSVSLNNSGANNVALGNSIALSLGISSVGTGTLELTGVGVSQTGTITQAASAGAVTINAGASTINLSSANAFTGSVSLNNSGANNVALTNSIALSLGTSNVGTGTLGLTGVGISQTGTITQAASAGTVTINAGSGAINLTNANTFTGPILLNNTGVNNVSLTNNGALSIGTSNVGSGTLGLTSNGAINQTGAITQAAGAGTVTISSTAASSDINLSTQANNFTGSITFGGTLGNIRDVLLRNIDSGATLPTNLASLSNLRNLSLEFNNTGIALPALILTSGGNLTATAGGAITQTGILIVPGTANFTAGGNVITLGQNNIFTGAVSLSNSGANNVSVVRSSGNLSLGTVNVGTGTLGLTSVGVSQTGTITQAAGAGAVTINAGVGAINLTNANSFTGVVSINNSGANNIALTNSGLLALGTSSIGTGTLGLTSVGISQTGAITQAAGAGAVTINAGSGAINLTSANSFTGAVSLNNSGANNVAVTNSIALSLGISNVGTGTLGLTGVGISQTGAITQTVGGGTVTINSGAGAISLTDAGNIFRGSVGLNNSGANNVALSNSIALSLGTSSVGTGTLGLTGVGVSQTGAITQAANAGAVTINAGAGIINLSSANAFTGIVSLNNSGTNNVSLTNNGALSIGTSNVGSGALGLTSNGAISQTGAITQAAGAGTVTVSSTAASSDINLNTQANNFTGDITFGGTLGNIRDVLLRNTNSSATLPTNLASLTDLRNLTLEFNNTGIVFPALALTNGGNLFVTAGGAITQTGVLTVPGTASFTVGANVITLGQNNVFTGAVSLSNSGSNNVTINNNANLTLAASTVGGKLTATSSGTISLSGSLSANATGDSIVLSGARFNNSGGFSLNPGIGRFLIWSSNANPFGGSTPDDRGGLAYNFKQYNATYGVTAVLGSGNGFIYTLSPAVTPLLIGTVNKSYNANTVATLAGANYSTSGVVDGDAVILNNPITGSYDNKNVGTGKNVAVSGITIASATNGGATVYGYQLSSTSANANVGVITAAPITISSDVGQTKVYGNNDSASAATAYSVTSGTLFGSDSLTGSMGRVSGENVGVYNFTQNTTAISDGNNSNNYVITFNGTTNKFQINARPLTGSIANQSKIYGANDPTLSGISVNLGNVVNTNVTDINGNNTPINDIGNVAATLASLTRATGEDVNAYNITAGTFNALTGSASGNYSGPTFSGSPTLTINQASLTGSIANQNKVYGANDPNISGINVTLGGLINNQAVVTWNGNVSIDDSGLTSSVSSLTRAVGENVGAKTITAASFTSASNNYSAPTLTGSPTLTINQASLTGSIGNQSKVYGADDPDLSGINVALSGLINNQAVITWNGNVSIDDSALTSNVSSLARTVGENVGVKAITAASFTSASSNYSAPTLTGSPTLTINQASLTGSIGNQSKIYGANDPTLPGITVTLSGLINNPTVVTWNGNVAIDDSALTSNVSSLVRNAGENVGVRAITAGALTAASGNYSLPTFTGTPTLTINQASLTGSIANQNKIYGADDPTLSGITVNLGGLINNPAIVTWNGNVSIDDSTLTSNVSSLTRAVEENVGVKAITSAIFTSASSNYSAPTLTGSPTLTINQASLAASIGNQNKIYGANDPSLPGINVALSGLINNPAIVTWNGNVAIDDSALTSNVSSLTRAVGENVGVKAITAGSFTAASSNYSAPTLIGSPTLTINQASLTGSIGNQGKIYGENDPTLSGITVTLSGLVNNPTVVTWNGNVAIDDSALTSNVSSLVRNAGENVGVRAITAGALTAASGNYSLPTFTGTPTLTINQASLTGSIANQNKIYGSDDPTLAGINVNLGGLINNSAVVTWNGNVSIDDSALTSSVLSLTRVVGENVGVKAITAASFTSASSNYSIPTLTGSPTLTINQASLTALISNQTKIYGADDPTLSSINVVLSGLINNPAIVTWNGNVTIDDSALTSNVTALTRAVGENAGVRAITAGTFSAASGNYSLPIFAGSPTLTINQAGLTASIGNQTKIYGADDPTLSSINVALSGLINNPAVVTWNGNVAIDDSALTSNASSLVRDAGENVGVRAITAGTLTAASGNYSLPTFTGTPTLTITQASLTGSIANQTKIYGANDPTLSGINVNLGGLINNPAVVTWNGNVSLNDSALTSSVSSLTRAVGENVGVKAITAASFTSASSNYSIPTLTGSPTLTINQASLTASIGNQTKIYGADDPTLSGINVALSGLINNPAVVTWNGNVTIDDSALTSNVTALTRAVGENVGVRAITAGTFSAASGNYSLPTFTGSPTLTISQASLSGSIANQNKIYGADDPTLSGINVTLGGLINNPAVVTWNGGVAINDSALTSVVTALTRAAGENVGIRAITAASFTAASSNYSLPTLTGSPTLTINQASLTGSIANQTKVYGANDPSFSNINVTLGRLINNPAIVTWNGNVAIDDSALTSNVTALTRAVGENVGTRAITAGTFSAASDNYTLPTFTGSPTLTIGQASLTGSIANQNKIYGADDPTLSGIDVTLGGLINNPAIVTWNGNVSIDDSTLTSNVTALTRAVGENVGVRAITAGTFSAASGNYSLPTFTGSPTLTISQASLTGAIPNQTKVYGSNDPTLSSINVTLGGLINNPAIVTWNGNVAIDDNALTSTVSSLARVVGENVGVKAITAASFTSASNNYNLPALTGSPILTISQASLTGSIANQTKVYGANDPALSSINVALGGLINNSAVVTWNGNVVIDDSALTSNVNSLTRAAGENVGIRAITAASFTAASGNYNLPTLTGSPTLTISQASLTGSIANQNKIYGADDPTLSGINVMLGGLINNPAIVTWNGNVSIDNSTLTSNVTALTRAVGENVGVRAITAGTFSAASGNYSLPTFTGSPTLTISQASLTGSIANQTKVYGSNDPTLSGINVTLGGLINNPAIVTWNGNVAIDDNSLTSNVTALTRAVGENVGVKAITAGTLTAASGNYSLPSFTGTPTLTINQAHLTGSITNQAKIYGQDDPAVSSIGVILGGLINNTAVITWNGNVSIDDSGLSSNLISLARTVGENVGVKAITAANFTSASGNYVAPILAGSPTLTINQASLTGSIANQNKIYGSNDPTLSGINVTLGGLINNPAVVTWNGNVAINDSALTSNVTSLTRTVGENVGVRAIAAGIFSSASSNYSLPTLIGAPTLTIDLANLTGSISNQDKVYGTNDPTLSGINVILSGLISNSAVVTWNGNVSINDSALTSSVTSLTRVAGENVGIKAINTGTFTAVSGNYNLPTFTGSPTLSINQASLTGSIANQAKVYGQNDPNLASISVALNGLINNPAIVTWNGNVAINDSTLTSSLSALTRVSGEDVGARTIISGIFTTPSANYSSPTLINLPTLTINQASLTGSINDQTKVYGTNDPSLSNIGVILTGLINNPSIYTWNGNVAINDSGLTASVSSLARAVGESVGNKAITSIILASNFSNYSPPTVVGSPVLTITPTGLAGTIANQIKVYGQSDPTPSSIPVILSGVINNPSVITWNGNVAIDDIGNVNTSLASLTRIPGENVINGPYPYINGTFNSLTGTAAGNYIDPSILSGSAVLTITPAGLLITANSFTKLVSAPDPVFTYNTSGLIGGIPVSQVLAGNLMRTAGQVPGKYPINIGSLASIDSNYNISDFTSGALTIEADPTSNIFSNATVQRAISTIVVVSMPAMPTTDPDSLGESTPLSNSSSGAITLFTSTSTPSGVSHPSGNGGSCVSIGNGIEICNK